MRGKYLFVYKDKQRGHCIRNLEIIILTNYIRSKKYFYLFSMINNNNIVCYQIYAM